jgi:hypothetical protein
MNGPHLQCFAEKDLFVVGLRKQEAMLILQQVYCVLLKRKKNQELSRTEAM